MNTLTKMALGLIGQLKPQPAQGNAQSALKLPPAQTDGGLPLMQALHKRQSQRAFEPAPLVAQSISDLLWAAAGINRRTARRTVPLRPAQPCAESCRRHRCSPCHGLSGFCGQRAHGTDLCGRPLAYEAGTRRSA